MTKGKGDPCWTGYEAAGMKEKNGRTVPNCIKSGEAGKAKDKAKAYKDSK